MNNLAESLRAQGDLAGARELQERVLSVTRRVLGPRHPQTTASAWNLYSALVEQGYEEAAGLVRQDLEWLLHAKPEELSHRILVSVRQMMMLEEESNP